MYELMNAKQMNIEHPDSFYYPSEEDIRTMSVGDFAKLGFLEDGRMGERMWVQVTKINGDDFEGTLDNEPISISSAKIGDNVYFKAMNIMDILDSV